MGITMDELAALANVSQGAVSLVLNGKAAGQISQKKQDLILRLAREHNYRVNMAAKVLRKQRQYVVGVIMPASLNPFYASMMTLLQRFLMQRSYMPLFTFLSAEFGIGKIYNSLYERHVDGIISWETTPEMFRDDIPMVFFQENTRRGETGIPENGRFCRCGFDYASSFGELYARLYADGHRKIGFIGMPEDPRRRMLKAFLDARGGECVCFPYHDSMTGDSEFFDAVFDMPERPTALVTTNDETARQLISAGYRRGIRFPQDISVTGFMDLPFARSMFPALTTVDSRSGQLAEAMVTAMLMLIERPGVPVEDTFIRTEPVIRDSCGPVSGK